jgi:uncharacterized protein YkwD
MKVKSFLAVAAILVVIITACSPTPATQSAQPPTETPVQATDTQVPPTIAPTDTPVPPTETAAAVEATLEPIGTNPTGCTNRADFVADVTVQDNDKFNPGQSFVKTWRLKNSGTCTWFSNYSLNYAQGEQMGAPASTPLTTTAPGQTIDISVNMTAPTQAGTFTGYYDLQDNAGQGFKVSGNHYVWLTIKVEASAGAGTGPTAAAGPTDTTSSGFTGTGTGTSGSCTYIESADYVSQILTLFNTARAAQGLPPYTINPQLSAAAMGHSIDMACNSNLSHIGTDGSTYKTRIAAQGYTASASTENTFAAPPQYGGNAQAAYDWWIGPGGAIHRDPIFSTTYKEIGIGYAYVDSSDLGGYFTVDFAAP